VQYISNSVFVASQTVCVTVCSISYYWKPSLSLFSHKHLIICQKTS